jgi:hypothetical protein
MLNISSLWSKNLFLTFNSFLNHSSTLTKFINIKQTLSSKSFFSEVSFFVIYNRFITFYIVILHTTNRWFRFVSLYLIRIMWRHCKRLSSFMMNVFSWWFKWFLILLKFKIVRAYLCFYPNNWCKICFIHIFFVFGIYFS